MSRGCLFHTARPAEKSTLDRNVQRVPGMALQQTNYGITWACNFNRPDLVKNFVLISPREKKIDYLYNLFNYEIFKENCAQNIEFFPRGFDIPCSISLASAPPTIAKRFFKYRNVDFFERKRKIEYLF
jgi:hypothetical protein